MMYSEDPKLASVDAWILTSACAQGLLLVAVAEDPEQANVVPECLASTWAQRVPAVDDAPCQIPKG